MAKYLDEEFKKLLHDNIDLAVPHYLVCSYLYYVRDVSIVSDHHYDYIARILKKHWKIIEHRHKYLLDYEELPASGAYLARIEWPLIVLGSAYLLARKSGQPMTPIEPERKQHARYKRSTTRYRRER